MKKNLMFIACLAVVFLSCLFFLSCSNDLEDNPPAEPVKIELTGEEKEIVGNQNDFSLDLFAALYKQKGEDKNSLFSPFCVYCTLGMLANGAVEENLDEILSVMNLDGYDREEMNGYFQKMIEGLEKADPAVKMKIANSIWHNRSVQLKDDFVRLNKLTYDAEIAALDFSQPEAAMQRINDWCKDKTEGKIEDLIKKGELSSETVTVLLNAIYFKARWEKVFSKEDTSDDLFHLSNGQTHTTPFMHKQQISFYYSNELFSTITLPYASETYYMRLVLPQENVSLDDVVSALERPGYLNDCLKDGDQRDVELALPKFEIQSEFSLNDALHAAGMNRAFDSLDGFKEMTDTPNRISKIKQAVCLKVDEEGSEGAAATASINTTSPFFEKAIFKADRPFLFMITENETGAILFVGTVETL